MRLTEGCLRIDKRIIKLLLAHIVRRVELISRNLPTSTHLITKCGSKFHDVINKFSFNGFDFTVLSTTDLFII